MQRRVTWSTGIFYSVYRSMQKETGRGGVVSINHVIKNNGCELDGLVIMEEGKHISPTIYLNGFYKQYQNGRTVEDIVRRFFTYIMKIKITFKFVRTGFRISIG